GVAASACARPAASRRLEDRRAVPAVGVRAPAQDAPRAEGHRVAVAERDLAGLDERAVVPDLELPSADCLQSADAVEARGRGRPGLGPEASAVQFDGLSFELEHERDRLHAFDRRSRRCAAVPWDYGSCGTGSGAMPSAARIAASCVRFETSSLR